MKVWIALTALALGGCSGVIPRTASSPLPPPRPSASIPPAPANEDGPAAPQTAYAQTGYRIVPATPMPALPSSAAVGATAATSGVQPGPALSSLSIDGASAARALAAFRATCPALRKRTDQSGLTQSGDWDAACAAALTASDARQFFLSQFDTVQVNNGAAFATGYFEPEIAASRTRGGIYQTPIYARPADLIDVDLGAFSDTLKGRKVAGRVEGTKLVPFADRTGIETGALNGKGLEIAWAADPVEFFFLQVQGSGRLKLADGSTTRIVYAGQNGRDYTGIGKLMKQNNMIPSGDYSMQGIVAWLRANPAQATEIMRQNKSFVFFKESAVGAIGSLNQPVAPQSGVAADPAFVPLGAPLFLSMDRADATGLWVAQDTGGAIKGPNRVDTFWGAGDLARAIAGGMSAHGTAFLLLPKPVVARWTANGATPVNP